MPMQFIELVKMRRSVRRYKDTPVPRQLIEKCVDAARYAPTSCNTQAWRFIATEGPLKDRIASEVLGGIVVPNKWAKTAPVIVVIAVDLDLVTHRIGAKLKGIDYHLIDAGIAGEHFILQATELGLGTCWIGWFDKGKVKKLLRIPRRWDVPAMIVLGYPDDKPVEKYRKGLDEVLDFRS